MSISSMALRSRFSKRDDGDDDVLFQLGHYESTVIGHDWIDRICNERFLYPRLVTPPAARL
jgi:hypothetical protein